MDSKQEAFLWQWQHEQQLAQIHGWDFSHLDGRYSIDPLPWDYRGTVLHHLQPQLRLLDLDTGGGEFLRALGHPACNTSATEFYPPNVRLCAQTLPPLGIEFRAADSRGPLPFPDGRFDLVLNRHGSYCPAELWRVLRPGGLFLTEQVGAQNDRALVELLLPGPPELPYPEQTLEAATHALAQSGFSILEGQEAFVPIRFWDVGALVWFARVIAWEFPGFSVERCLLGLLRAQQRLEADGVLEGQAHRYLIVAQKAKE